MERRGRPGSAGPGSGPAQADSRCRPTSAPPTGKGQPRKRCDGVTEASVEPGWSSDLFRRRLRMRTRESLRTTRSPRQPRQGEAARRVDTHPFDPALHPHVCRHGPGLGRVVYGLLGSKYDGSPYTQAGDGRTQERLTGWCSTPLSAPVACARMIASSCAPNRNAVVEMYR